MILIQKEAVKKYREMCSRGICAHAALVHAVNWLFLRGHEEGFTLGSCMSQAKQLTAEIKELWEDA